MIYIFFVIFSCLYFSNVSYSNARALLIKSIPVIILWTVIAGGQYNVGTDYENYLDTFKDPTPRYEPLFSWITVSLFNLGFKGQFFFFFYAWLNIVVLLFAISRYRIRNLSFFFFLIVIVSTFFNAQMNGIRQCATLPFVFLAFYYFYEEKWKGVLLIILAACFHYSALVCILFLYIDKTVSVFTKFPRILLILSCIVPFITIDDSVTSQLISLIPEDAVSTTRLSNYKGDTAEAKLDFIYTISKLYFIPLYWWSLMLLKKQRLTEYETKLFNLGIFCSFLKIALLINLFIGRFSYFFWIPAVFPLYYLMRFYKLKRKYHIVAFIMLYCSLIYLVKVIVQTPGYTYEFYLFK